MDANITITTDSIHNYLKNFLAKIIRNNLQKIKENKYLIVLK